MATQVVNEDNRLMIVELVKQLVKEKPSDPVPFMYAYLKQISQGVHEPVLPTNLQVAEMKNLRKKLAHLKS